MSGLFIAHVITALQVISNTESRKSQVSLSPRTTKLWRGYRVCPVRMYVSTYVRTYVRSYVHPS